MSEKLRLVPGMYSLQIRTAKTCCVRFKDTPFGMAWMTDINLLIDTPSDEKDMATIRKMLDSLEAVPYRNCGDMEQHAAEANLLLEKTRNLFEERVFGFYEKEPHTLFVMGATHASELPLVSNMMIIVSPMYI